MAENVNESWYQNSVALEDGAILLYQRADSPSGRWQCRMLMPNGGGYVTKSTRKVDLDEAKRVALDFFTEIKFKIKHDMPVRERNFERTFGEWIEARSAFMSPKRVVWHQDTGRRYLFRHFNPYDLTEIDEAVLAQYWEWRQSPESTLDHTNAKETASSATLYMERDTLNQFFKWCERNTLIRRRPQIEMPVKLVRNRRPAFEIEEYRHLCRKMRSWCREHEKPDLVYQREMVRHFVLFCCQSGLRPKECKSLKWKHLSTFVSNAGMKLLLVHVHPQTKTGERQCVPMLGALRTIERWREISRYIGEDDYVFANYWGDFYTALERPVNKLLEYAGLRKDKFGRNRTAYSFRHTYATFRLLYGDNVDIYVLARNMGTSVEMIEKHYGHVVPQQQAEMLTSMRVIRRPHKEIFNDEILSENVIPFPERAN